VNVYNSICGCYCKYFNELCYKAPVNGIIVMSSIVVIVNTATSCVIKLRRQYALVFSRLLVVGVIEHRGQCSPKWEGFIKTLVKNPCKS